MGALLDFSCHKLCLLGTNDHALGVAAVDEAKHGTLIHDGAVGLLLAHATEGAVDAGGLEVDIKHADELTVHVDVGPHAAVVSLAKVDGKRVYDRVAAEDNHVTAAGGL